jgi:aryl-alcohol dehydrogenase-like predicted oxidoreductase
VSNYRGWRIAEVVSECEAQGVPLPVVCQPYYNLLNRMPEVEILPACDTTDRRRALLADRARRAHRQVRAGRDPEDSRARDKDRR